MAKPDKSREQPGVPYDDPELVRQMVTNHFRRRAQFEEERSRQPAGINLHPDRQRATNQATEWTGGSQHQPPSGALPDMAHLAEGDCPHPPAASQIAEPDVLPPRGAKSASRHRPLTEKRRAALVEDQAALWRLICSDPETLAVLVSQCRQSSAREAFRNSRRGALVAALRRLILPHWHNGLATWLIFLCLLAGRDPETVAPTGKTAQFLWRLRRKLGTRQRSRQPGIAASRTTRSEK